MMKFLITNDDGFDAPGLAALYEALRPIGHVTVVAPAECHSAKGHAVNTKQPIRVEQREVPPFGRIRIVHSSPADCVRIGLGHVMRERPDYVIAGINPGANLGVDLFYSGTAAAAREAAILGVPAIALSRLLHDDFPVDWAILAGHANRVVRTILRPEYVLPAGHFWNVNFPTIRDEKYPDQLTIVPQGTEPHAVQFAAEQVDENTEILKYSGQYRERLRSQQTDVHHLFEQRITATPVGPSLTSDPGKWLHSEVSLLHPACAD